MRRLALIALLFSAHLASATIKLDVEKFKELKSTAAENLQTFAVNAVTGIKQLKETASSNLKDLTAKATDGLHHLVDEIDVKNLHKLDILDLVPALKHKYQIIKDLYNKPETKVNVIHIYGDDLNSHFDHAKVKLKKYHPAPVRIQELPHHHHSDHHHHHHLEHYHILPKHYHTVPYPLDRLGY